MSLNKNEALHHASKENDASNGVGNENRHREENKFINYKNFLDMEKLNRREFSKFEKMGDKSPQLTTLKEVCEFVRQPSDPYAERIDKAIEVGKEFNRIVDLGYSEKEETYKKAEKKYREIKERLPFFAYGCTLDGSHGIENIVYASDVMGIDLDDLKEDEVDELYAKLREDEYIHAVFKSPSRRGLKAFLRLEEDALIHLNNCIDKKDITELRRQYRQMFEEVSCWFVFRYGVQPDAACKNINRLCFYSRDEKAYYNDSPKKISFKNINTMMNKIVKEIEPEYLKADTIQSVYDFTMKYHNNVEGNRNNSLYMFSSWALNKGFSEADILAFAQERYSLDEAEIRKTIKSAKESDIANRRGKYGDVYLKSRRLEERKKSIVAKKIRAANDRPSFSQLLPSEVIEMLSERYEFRINLITGNRECLIKDSDTPEWVVVDDLVTNSVTSFLREKAKGLRSREWEPDVFNNSTPVYDPIIDYLNGLPEHDGHDHIKEFCSLLKTDDDEYAEKQIRHFMASMVNTMLHREINQNMIVFTGAQGVGKTTVANCLLPKELDEYKVQAISSALDKKQDNIYFETKALVNVDEIKDFQALRNYLDGSITQLNIKDRVLFTERLNDRKRLASYVGTTNEEGLLKDEDGERRYVIIRLLNAKLEEIRSFDMNLVLSQAMDMLENGYDVYKNPETDAERAERNRQFKIVCPTEELFDKCFTYSTSEDDLKHSYYSRKTASEISDRIQSTYTSARNEVSPVKIGQLMRKLGVIRDDKRKGYRRYLVRLKPEVGSILEKGGLNA